MRKRISLIAGLTVLFAVGAAGATDCPESPVNAGTNEATGHVFEVYSAPRITWLKAKACAESMVVGGVAGHLATITSSAEDAYVNDLRKNANLREVWVGGSQIEGSSEPGGGWRWENGEGSISTPPAPSYSNWLDGEPNDLGDSESHLAIGLGGDFGWNDEGNLSNITGYIVEYDIPRTAECTVGVDCETIEGQTLIFPEGSFDPDGDQTIGFTAFEFIDPRVAGGKCGIDSLTLFRASDGFTPGVELRIPAYLCGSPRFLVVKVDATDLTIESGAVEVVNDTEVVLPDNLFECTGPKVPVSPRDPQQQDVVVWQSTNPDDMLEASLGTGVFAGAATEATNGCGSTRAKVRTGSYFVVGMHIDFGGQFDYQGFVALTRYKLTLLQHSVADARSAGALRYVVSLAMGGVLQLAVRSLDRGDPVTARILVKKFLKLVDLATYAATSTGFNFEGDHLMRGENIVFTLQDKVIPFVP
jgi:hypothetical protein